MEKGTKILVVDDEKGICRNIAKILSKNNYEVIPALSAKEALEKMSKESFSLLISDIVMPEMNGLELLKLAKSQWPLTKVVMMTAYASTDTALKAVRLGALDYLPKPFTPNELRSTVDKALSGELQEAATTDQEKKAINVIDIDIPFDRDEVAQYTGEAYAGMLGPSDMPVVEMPAIEPAANYCLVGEMSCDIFEKLGNTCKAGIKLEVCPQKKKKSAKKEKGFDAKALIGIDQPFDFDEVAAVTGPEYVTHLHHEGLSQVPYEEVKKNVARMTAKRKEIDVDMPFDMEEVARVTGEDYAMSLSSSDMPIVEVPAAETGVDYCLVGEMSCEIFKKLGNTCKAGVKTALCPQKKAKTKGKKKGFDAKKFIGIDQPFHYDEVVSVTGPEYVENLQHEGVSFIPYEELKNRVRGLDEKAALVKAAVESELRDILVVDDEVAVNNNIRKILTKKGYRVDQAASKEEALEKIAEKAYRVVLLDLRMPGVKGLELLKAIRDERPDTSIIIITGYASIETAVETARMGAVDFVSKPFTPDEIRNATENVLRLAA